MISGFPVVSSLSLSVCGFAWDNRQRGGQVNELSVQYYTPNANYCLKLRLDFWLDSEMACKISVSLIDY